jgi:integrase
MARGRGNNEGSIYQRRSGDGRWVAAVTYIDAEGRKRRKSWYGATREDAADKFKKGAAALVAGYTPTNDRITVGRFLEGWLRDTAKPRLRASTYASYESYCRNHIIPGLGKIVLSRLTPAQVEAFLRKKAAEGRKRTLKAEDVPKGLNPRSVVYMRAILRSALRTAERHGLVHRNVAALAEPPRVTRTTVQPLTTGEARAFLAGIKGDRHETLYITAIATGLRQGEILGLRWVDVDLDAGTITVRQARERVKGAPTFGEPKSATSRRTITLPEIASTALKAHRTAFAEARLAKGPDWQDPGLVFTTPEGAPLDGSAITHRFQRKLADLGLPRQRFHDLRHLTATLMLGQGVPARVVMEQLGHSQIALTMNTYSHVMPELQRDAAEKLNAVLSG